MPNFLNKLERNYPKCPNVPTSCWRDIAQNAQISQLAGEKMPNFPNLLLELSDFSNQLKKIAQLT